MTSDILKEMKHCLGLTYANPKWGKYRAYRNYCYYRDTPPVWSYLIDKGYGEVYIRKPLDGSEQRAHYFSLTQVGIAELAKILGHGVVVST